MQRGLVGSEMCIRDSYNSDWGKSKFLSSKKKNLYSNTPKQTTKFSSKIMIPPTVDPISKKHEKMTFKLHTVLQQKDFLNSLNMKEFHYTKPKAKKDPWKGISPEQRHELEMIKRLIPHQD
eukprot:TRINITY_DN14358_c0_g1_i1.p1 TRINITY_DN14358_c0_g1~~TRINITY_DN14358_c0_g1_i1.p1  ORF type:complete len:121 (+),score=25.95 TRINITY_DN14358_c0_g1_i1:94-456(+)